MPVVFVVGSQYVQSGNLSLFIIIELQIDDVKLLSSQLAPWPQRGCQTFVFSHSQAPGQAKALISLKERLPLNQSGKVIKYLF